MGETETPTDVDDESKPQEKQSKTEAAIRDEINGLLHFFSLVDAAIAAEWQKGAGGKLFVVSSILFVFMVLVILGVMVLDFLDIITGI